MSKKIVVVNAGPRKGWNTDMLITEAQKGAEAAGAEIQRFDLFRLERYESSNKARETAIESRKEIRCRNTRTATRSLWAGS